MASVVATTTRSVFSPRSLVGGLKAKIFSSQERERGVVYHVVHPLDDIPEKKVNVSELGLMKMTPATRISLLMVRGYLVSMALLVVYHVICMVG